MHMVEKTRDWLRGNHILVNDDWLKACVEWIQEENQGHGLTDEDTNAQVYEQWLLADLHELETCCLPAEVVSSQKFELSGAYALQIDSIVDVGVSFYSQQQKLKGTENANVNVNADEPTQKPWEPKPSRMLMFKLTDGRHCVQGMEYRPISCLSPQTSPGAKILVHGNVLCRHGVLMLSDSNIRFLGGEVDTLVEANTVLNTLQSAMEASEEHSGKEHQQTYSGSQVRHNKQAVAGNQGNHGNQRNSWGNSSNVQRSNQFSQSRHTDVKPPGNVKVEPVSQTNVIRNNSANNQNLADYDGFSDDDMADIMEEMDAEDFQHRPAQNVQDRNYNQVKTNTGSHSQIINHSANQSHQVKTSNIKTSVSQRTGAVNNRNQVKSSDELVRQVPAKSSGVNDILHNDDLDAMDFEDDMDFPPMDDDFMTSPNMHTIVSEQNSSKNLSSIGDNQKYGNSTANKIPSSFSAGTDRGNFSDNSKHQSTNRNSDSSVLNLYKQGNSSSVTSSSNRSVNLMTGSLSVVSNNVDVTVNITGKGVNMSVSNRRSDTSKIGVNTSVDKNNTKAKLSLPKVKTEAVGRSSASATSVHNHKAQQTSIENFLTPNKPVKQEQAVIRKENSGPDIQTEYPFTYLAKVMSLPAQEQPSYHTVKAYISTLTSKLTTVDGKWTLACKINDGTMAVDVDLSNQVLTQMIGFSPKEAQEMKLRVKTDPSVKEVLQEGIQQCQQKLIELMCLLELETCTRHPRPVIVATKQLTSHHIDMLYNRVMASWNTGI